MKEKAKVKIPSKTDLLLADLWCYSLHGTKEQAQKVAAEIGTLTGKHATAKAYLRHVLAIRKLEAELGVE